MHRFLEIPIPVRRGKKAEPRDDDKKLSLIKDMLNVAKGEDIHIFDMVDEHAREIAVKLSSEKIDEYLKFREQIAHERVDDYERKKGKKQEQKLILKPHRKGTKEQSM